MVLRILGPLELTVGGRPADLGGVRQRVVLAMLAVQAGRVVSVEQLIDAIWDTAPPPTARAQIQICVSALRRLFAEAGHRDAIQTRPPGYVLRFADLDRARFEELVSAGNDHLAAGRVAEAAESLGAALELWRGPALADIQQELPRRSALVLDDARFAAHLAYLRAELMLGRHREIIGPVRALIGEHPLREEPYELLMTALHLSGRQADALATYREARAVLVEEVGVEPGPELRRLERAILKQQPIDQPGQEIPQQLQASVGDFTGRESELASIVSALGQRGRFSAPIVAVSGRGGVGKSTLAIRAGHELGTAYPDGQLFAELKDRDTGEVLTRFLSALGVAGPAMPEDPEDRLKLYRSKVAGRRMLVVLDDADDERQVQPLVPGGRGCAVIVTSRTRLGALPGASFVELEEFPEQAALALLTRIVGADRVAAEREAAAELVTLCGGLPLALRIAGARLASRRHWRVGDLVSRLSDEARRLDEFVYHSLELRSTIGLTYHALDGRAQRLFRLCGLVQAPDFASWTAAALLGTGVGEAEELLDVLVESRLLDVVTGGRAVRYRFHNLVRVYAVEQAAADPADERQAALARMVGAWLTLADGACHMHGGSDDLTVHGDAERWWAGDVGPADVIGEPSTWWKEEREPLIAAIRQSAVLGMDEACWDLVLAATNLFEVSGHYVDWLALTELALEGTERAGNDVGTAAMHYSRGYCLLTQSRLVEAIPFLDRARELFASAGHEHGLALALHFSALIDRLRGDAGPMYPKYLAALRHFRALGRRVGEAIVLSDLGRFWTDQKEYERAEKTLGDALAIVREAGSERPEAQMLHRLADVYLATGRVDLAARALGQVLAHVRAVGDLIGEAYTLCSLGSVHRRQGDLERAETTLGRALILARQVNEAFVEGQVRYALAQVALETGDGAAAAGHLGEADRIFTEVSSALWRGRVRELRLQLPNGVG